MKSLQRDFMTRQMKDACKMEKFVAQIFIFPSPPGLSGDGMIVFKAKSCNGSRACALCFDGEKSCNGDVASRDPKRIKTYVEMAQSSSPAFFCTLATRVQ